MAGSTTNEREPGAGSTVTRAKRRESDAMPEDVAPTTNEPEAGSTVTRAKRRESNAMPEDVAPTTNERERESWRGRR